jgi:uncharacterized iron-regulated protein
VRRGEWLAPADRLPLETSALFERLAHRRIVLLGEKHDSAEHHRWQLHTIAALESRRPKIVLGFEMFARRAQPALDRWVAGTLTEREFLAESQWSASSSLPAELYSPLFQFARMHGARMLALNVERATVARISERGWMAVPPAEREDLSEPAPPTKEYEQLLSEVYDEHAHEGGGHASGGRGLAGFVDAQLAWDRAMAEAIAAAASDPDTLVVGIIGAGHLEHRYGVPHQLASLGWRDVAVLLPWDEERDCADLTPDFADAVFGLAPPVERKTTGPRLGVILEPAADGVRVARVEPDSVAAATGILADDIVFEAAGSAVAAPDDLRATVLRQAPGTWLPLRIRRAGKVVEVVARFPAGE